MPQSHYAVLPRFLPHPLGGTGGSAPQRMIGLCPQPGAEPKAHGSHVLQKLGVPESEDGHRRVLAVLAHLGALHPRTEPRSQVSRASVARRLTNDLRVRQVRRNAGVNTGWLGVIRFPHQLTYPWCSRGAAGVAGDREAGVTGPVSSCKSSSLREWSSSGAIRTGERRELWASGAVDGRLGDTHAAPPKGERHDGDKRRPRRGVRSGAERADRRALVIG
jgi:hypothetical protein